MIILHVGCNWDANGAAFYLMLILSNEQWQEADKLIKEVWKEFVAEQEKAGKPVKSLLKCVALWMRMMMVKATLR